MFKLDKYMYLVLVPGVLLFTVCVADVSTQTWFYCFGDYCNVKKNMTEEFCSVKFQKCRPCSEVVDDCFTPEMPLNCTLTCLDQYKERILKEEIAKPCQEIQEIDNGNHNGSHSNILEPGTIIHYSCISGHRLVGFDNLQCMQYGQWTSPPPRCEEVLCPVLSPISNGHHNGSLKRHAPTVTIITLCDDGFQLIGENTTTCSGDGQWTNHLPTCKPMFCGKLPPIRHGKWVQLDEHTDHFTHGDTLYAQCDTDYRIDNPSAWICQKGLWTSNVSFVPNCFTQGESCHNSSMLIIVGGVLFLFLII
ncbi:P-selectin-like isoform X2 [Ruditapes philippinarum]|uniref:P-selectin-like isoform X2 n=1 Tax=Ruditapes philippinarum TaxID=129788 RepID=UPI00295B3DFB|nr:P-selectin-like isoform X2 [Ruditapes philippinarum]